jgi:hypothetical protein
MCTQHWTELLRAMGRTYPDSVDLDAVCQRTGFDGSLVRRAVWDLVEHGFLTIHGSPSWAGLPWSQPRLTRAGVAVAMGLGSVEDDPRGATRMFESPTPNEMSEHGIPEQSWQLPLTPEQYFKRGSGCLHAADKVALCVMPYGDSLTGVAVPMRSQYG